MAMNSLQLKGVILDQNKKVIIKRYNEGVGIHILAGEYNVGVDTICRRLRTWGEKVRKGDYHRKKKNRKHWYRKFSKEFIKNRAMLTKKYGNLIKYPKGFNKTSDQKLVRNILNRPIIG